MATGWCRGPWTQGTFLGPNQQGFSEVLSRFSFCSFLAPDHAGVAHLDRSPENPNLSLPHKPRLPQIRGVAPAPIPRPVEVASNSFRSVAEG